MASAAVSAPSSGVVVHVPLSFIAKGGNTSASTDPQGDDIQVSGDLSQARSSSSGSSGPHRPILYTTVIDAPPLNLGTKGYCLFENCTCEFYAGPDGTCTRCSHPSAFHSVRPRRADVEAKEALIAKRKQKHFKRAERERREAEAKKLSESTMQAAQRSVNHFPCEVDECECKRFEPLGAPPPMGKVSIRKDGAFILNEYDAENNTYSCDPMRLVVPTEPLPPPEPSQFISPAWASQIASAPKPGEPIPNATIPVHPDPAVPKFKQNYELQHQSQLVVHEPLYTPPVDLAALKLSTDPASATAQAQPNPAPGSSLLPSSSTEFTLPRICKRCKHGEYLHTKAAKDKKKSGRGGQSSRPPTAASTPANKAKKDAK